MRTIGESPAQVEPATAPSVTETIPADVPLGAGTNSCSTGDIVETEAVPVEQKPEQTRLPSRAERLEPLIRQQKGNLSELLLFSRAEKEARFRISHSS